MSDNFTKAIKAFGLGKPMRTSTVFGALQTPGAAQRDARAKAFAAYTMKLIIRAEKKQERELKAFQRKHPDHGCSMWNWLVKPKNKRRRKL